MSITTLQQAAPEATPSETEATTPETTSGIYWTLNEAARQTGLNKGNVSRHISEGKLQWHDRPQGKRLHAAEVMHFYADRIQQRRNRVAKVDTITSLQPITNEGNTPQPDPQLLENAVKLATAETEIKYLKEMLDVERDRREKAEQEQNRWHKAYDELKLLPAPTSPPVAASPAPEQPIQKPNFWGRLLGK